MAHDVFVSYSTKDKPSADAVCAGLEADGIRCWIAPRDILPGRDWGETIIDAIGQSKVMVLVFSVSANESPQVKREVQRAFERNITVVPVRIDEVMPAKAFEYYLSPVHWLDAALPLEGHIHKLVEIVRQLLPARVEKPVPVIAETITQQPAPALDYHTPPMPAKRRPAAAWFIGGAMFLALAAGVAYLVAPRYSSLPAKRAATVVQIPATQAATTAPSDPLKTPQAIREVFGDLRKLDNQLALLQHDYGPDMTASKLEFVRSLDAPRESFASMSNVSGTDHGSGYLYGPDVVPDRVAAMRAAGANPEDVQAFSDALTEVKDSQKDLPYNVLQWGREKDLVTTVIKLKFGVPGDLADLHKMQQRRAAALVEASRLASLKAHYAAIHLLESLQSGLPDDADAQLGALKSLQPSQLISKVQLKSLEDQLATDQAKFKQSNASFETEFDQWEEQRAYRWSGALRAPFKLTDLSMAELAPLCATYDLDGRGSESNGIFIILNAANDRYDENKIPCLFEYAVLFSKMDPTAEEYARASCQFTLQARWLKSNRALYLANLLNGPAKDGGLREGDLLIDYGGTEVSSTEELGPAIKQMPEGEPVRVEFFRRDEQGRFHRQTATLPHGGSLGATFLPI